MRAQGALREVDLRLALELLEDCARATDLADLGAQVVRGVRRMVPCEAAQMLSVDERLSAPPTIVVGPAGRLADGFAAGVVARHREHPVVSYQLETGDGSAAMMSDFVSQRQLRDTGLYADLIRQQQVEDVLAISFHLPGSIGAVCLYGPWQGFGVRERTLLEVLRPFLAAHACRVTSPPDRPMLSARERAVLALVADGLADKQVATRLGVSRRTVSKHLEHTYRKLGVTNRTAAVATWSGGG